MSPRNDPPVPVSLTDDLRRVKRGTSVFFDRNPRTIRRLLLRIRDETPSRKFKTANEAAGVRVWRTA